MKQILIGNSDDLTPEKIPAYSKDNNDNENSFNKLTNKLAANIYSYNDKSDYTYGRL
jgi:hypothetical protein